MGEMVTFPSNGGEAQGYLAVPDGGQGPGVVVIEEWWGLNQQIKEVCDRYASEGFVALGPDVYGREVPIGEPDEAAKMMMALNVEQAAKDLSGAVDYLQGARRRDRQRHRRHRLLRRRRARALARDAAAGRGQGGRAVLRAHPVA